MIECGRCGREVIPVKRFNWLLFLLLAVPLLVGALLYLIYFTTKPAIECPACGCEDVYQWREYCEPTDYDQGIVIQEDDRVAR